jgi:ribosomal protein S16
LPVVGDWNGNGITDIGVFYSSSGRWDLDVSANFMWDGCSVDSCTYFGTNGDLPAVGDWNANGISKIGVFRPSTGRWYLDTNGNRQWDGCGVDACLGPFGMAGDLPVAGDWNGNGIDKIGVFRPSTGKWYLDLNNNRQWDGCGVDGCATFGVNGDLPVVGDWNGDGIAQIGVFRPSKTKFYLDLNGNRQWDSAVDGVVGYGINGDRPVAGKW